MNPLVLLWEKLRNLPHANPVQFSSVVHSRSQIQTQLQAQIQAQIHPAPSPDPGPEPCRQPSHRQAVRNRYYRQPVLQATGPTGNWSHCEPLLNPLGIPQFCSGRCSQTCNMQTLVSSVQLFTFQVSIPQESLRNPEGIPQDLGNP